jgi:hypothetical protein
VSHIGGHAGFCGAPEQRSRQSSDRLAAIDIMRPILRVVPRNGRQQTECLIDRGSQVVTSLCQLRQVFTNLDSRSLRGDRLKLAANIRGRIRLEVKAL